MKSDLYMNIILTAIAVLLGVLALGQLVRPQTAGAEGRIPYTLLQFDQSLSQIQSSKGTVIGRVAIDLRTGRVYGFPTDAVGYPRNPAKEETAMSDPILLGQFNLDKLPN